MRVQIPPGVPMFNNSMVDMSYDEYQILSSVTIIQKIVNEGARGWLNEHVGENWYYSYTPSKIFFKYEEDKVKFILRWM